MRRGITPLIRMAASLAIAMLLPLGGCAAQTITPANLAATLARARGGERIVLTPGDYGAVMFPARRFARPLLIDASRATFTGLTLRGVSGVTIRGARISSPRSQTFGIAIVDARDIRIESARISGARVAISIVLSQDIAAIGNDFAGTRSDGVNIAASQRVRVERNSCTGFDPVPAIYSPDGKLVQDGDHPDCIQGWSIVGRPPTADVTIVGNRGVGFMQGIFFGNPGQGGYDRLVVRDNRFRLSAFNGIVITGARDADIRDNVVETEPGAKMHNYPFKPVTSWIRLDGRNVQACGNVVGHSRNSDGTGRCRRNVSGDLRR